MNNIRKYRNICHLSQEELGKRLHVTGATVSSWEVGRTEPNIDQATLMARIFHCSLEQLFDRENSQKDIEVEDNSELLETWRQLSEEEKNILLNLAKLLTQNKK